MALHQVQQREAHQTPHHHSSLILTLVVLIVELKRVKNLLNLVERVAHLNDGLLLQSTDLFHHEKHHCDIYHWRLVFEFAKYHDLNLTQTHHRMNADLVA